MTQLMPTEDYRANNLDAVVRESLRTKILSGELEGGFHLSELKISKDYNVSRTPVREALCALAADGLVEMVPHRGAFVTHIPAQTKTDQLQAYAMFMGLLAKMAAEKASIDMLMDLETAFAFASDENQPAADLYLASIESAFDITEKTANSPTISEALNMLGRRTNLKDVWQGSPSLRAELNPQFSLLLAALKRKKADSAEKTMRQLITTVTDKWVSTHASEVETANDNPFPIARDSIDSTATVNH